MLLHVEAGGRRASKLRVLDQFNTFLFFSEISGVSPPLRDHSPLSAIALISPGLNF